MGVPVTFPDFEVAETLFPCTSALFFSMTQGILFVSRQLIVV